MIRWFFLLAVFWVQVCAFAVESPAEEKRPADLTVEQFLQQLSTVPGVLSRKDPFNRPAPPYQSILDSWRAQDTEGGARQQTDLERYEIKDYKVQAVLLGDVYNRALVKIPDNSAKVMIVRENDRLGNRGGTISKIEQAGVTVVQKTRSRTGVVDHTTVVLPVGDAQAAGGK